VNDPVPVVIVDYQPEKIKQMLMEINRPELITNFYFPGYVPSEDMPLLYNSCTVFLYPSLRESFGLPVLEAMACGIPVISSKIPAIMEVAGEAAELVDPSHPIAIAEAIQQFVNDESLRDVYKQKGLARASLFSWEISAKKLLDVYITIMASP
jgi:glycosyltransferase involved in cell wall biosynthesis